MLLGSPQLSANRFSIATTRAPEKPVSTSMAGRSRLMVSTTVKTRNRRPSYTLSLMRVHAPLLVGRVRRERDDAWRTDPLLARFEAQGESLQPIEPVHPLHVDGPAFASQQRVHPTVAVAHAHRGDLPDALPQRGLILCPTPLAIPCPVHADDPARASFTHPKADLEKADTPSAAGSASPLFSQHLRHACACRASNRRRAVCVGDAHLRVAAAVAAQPLPSQQISASSARTSAR